MLKIGEVTQDAPLHLVGQMLKLSKDKWVTETENEIWQVTRVDNNFCKMNPFYGNVYMQLVNYFQITNY
jgi:hypothetical protein